MKKFVFSIILLSLITVEQGQQVYAQKGSSLREGKQGGTPPQGSEGKKQGKRPPPGWTPPDGGKTPPPPPGWQAGDPVPPPPDGWTPPAKEGSDNKKATRGKKGKGGKKEKGGKGQKPKGKQNERPKDKNTAPRISKWTPEVYPREIGDVVELRDSQTLNKQVVDLAQNKMKEKFFILFMNQTCEECKKGASELAKLGKMSQDSPKIARADCTFDREACDIFVNHLDASKGKYPFMVMATPQRTHIYNGPIDAQKIYDDFLKEEKYLEFEIHGGKGHSSAKIIENGLKFIQDQTIETEQKKRLNDPYWFEEAFAFCFAKAISMVFFHIGMDYWRKECKIAIFIAGILIPAAIVIFQTARAIFNSKENQNKIEEEVKKIKNF